ncbi:MAG TPA: hypothetical protein VM076_11345 [Gemmatimonadaceae bacterium]|nr:hypothetical protein [Gemmatimonadaceae bacterium]
MRDEHVLPIDRENAGRGENGAGRENDPSSAQEDGISADLRTDAPAPLSALSHPADAEDPGLSDEEITTYRQRVADGMYNTREVADEVARRMLRRGDI